MNGDRSQSTRAVKDNGSHNNHDWFCWIVAREAKAPLMAEYPEDVDEVEEALLERPADRLSVIQSEQRVLLMSVRPRQPRS